MNSVQVGIDEANRVPPSDGGIGASFLLGHAGIYGLASVIFHELGTDVFYSRVAKGLVAKFPICFARMFDSVIFDNQCNFLLLGILLCGDKSLGHEATT